MSKEYGKYFKVLELDKVLHMLAERVSSDSIKEVVESIEPVYDVEKVRALLQETSDAHMLIARFKSPSFAGLSDVHFALKRAKSGATLSTTELLRVADNLHVFNLLEKFREQFSSLKTALDERFEKVIANRYLENKVKTCIISEDEIADEASPELASIRRKIRRTSESIRERLDKMVRTPSIQKFLQENIVTIKSERFVLPVRAEYRREISGLVHETSSSGATVFIEPTSIVDANNEIKILHQKEKQEIEKILRDLSFEVGGFVDNILSSYEVCVELDVIFAKAELAHSMKAVLPKLNCDGKINLINARHPLIDRKKVVPMSISLGTRFDTLVITGPNTGGKTVTLKAVGLFVLMTMCGLMIPASEQSEISVFEHVLADIGDEQSIEQSLSTFSSHMVNIIKILSLANGQSLVLLDELGAGTDPVEGAALAVSILETLREKKCKILATTHYAELKSYALSTLNVENACCEFDIRTLAPTYKLLIGVPGSSNAFAISQRLGMPAHVVETARGFLSDENVKFEKVIKTLEETRNVLEREKADVDKIKSKLTLEMDTLKKEKNLVKGWRDEELKKAKAQAERVVSSAKAMAEELIEEIKDIKKNARKNDDAIRKLKSNLNNIDKVVDPIDKKENSDYMLPRKLKVGDSVLIFDLDKEGTVLEINSSSDDVLVQAGIIKTRVPIANIRLIGEIETKKRSSVSSRGLKSATRSVARELDVRGKTVLEAELELDAFIDNAILSSINMLTVIHGKGTGVLREEISKYLKRHPNVKSFRRGVLGEGESGVTIVELK